jgi:gas vesicle protein
MQSARLVARSSLPRAARTTRAPRSVQQRLQSTASSSTSSTASSSTSHIAAGVAGGVASAAALYTVYSFTPSGRLSSSLNKTAKDAAQKYQEAAKKFQQSTPDAGQTVNYIKEFAYSYVTWIPGGRQFVDAAFKDVETVQKNHKDEADKILNDAYKQLQSVSKQGLTMAAATQAFEVLADISKKLAELAGDALEDIVDNHPQVKERLGGSIDQLKQLGQQYGPEAKKVVDGTWKEMKDIFGQGFGPESVNKARKLVEQKVEELKKFADEAWQKGLEQAKPILDKNPKVKELIEKNADALKQGNAKELFDRAKEAVETNNIGNLEEYVNGALKKAKTEGSKYAESFGLEKYFDLIPEGSDVWEKIKQLKQVADKHSKEGQQLLEETKEEVKRVLEDKSKKAQDIAEKAKKEAK